MKLLRFFSLLSCSVIFGVVAAVAQTESRRALRLQSPPPMSPLPALKQAQNLLSTGKTDAAIEMLLPISKTDPSDLQVKYLLGLAFYQKGDLARAIENLSVAIEQIPAGSAQYNQGVQFLGLAHYSLGHLKEAVPFLEKAMATVAPGDVEIAYVLGISLIQTRDYERARGAFARMFNVEPASAPAHLINAQMLIRQGFEEFAEKELQKALAIDPKLPQANFLLGELAIFRAQINLGIELLQKEIALNPAFGMAYYRLGEAYTRQLKWDESIAPLQKSIWLNPYFSGPYIVLGKVHLKKGDLAGAESILRRALRMDANNFSGHHLLAQVLQQANRREEAKKEFELAEQLRTSSDKQ